MLGHARAFPLAACGGTTRRERQSENGVGSAVNSCRWINIPVVLCKLFAASQGNEKERERGRGGEKRNTREVVRVYRVFAQIKI